MKQIWSIKGRAVKNRSLAFVYDYSGESKTVELRISASNVFRLFLNGELFGYGPRRSAHGYSNINEYSLRLNRGDRIVAEVAGYNINSYYLVNELPFFACEIKEGETLLAQAEDFRCFILNDRVQKVQRYSFQRPFAESYVMQKDRQAFYRGENIFPETQTCEVTGNIEKECNLPYPTFETSDCSVLEVGTVDLAEKYWLYQDRSIQEINDTLLGYTYNALEDKLSDEASRFHCTADFADCETLSGRYRLYDFGRIVTGFISSKVTVKEKCELYFLFDEILWDEASENPALREYMDQDTKALFLPNHMLNPNARDNMNTAALPLVFWRLATCNVLKFVLEPGEYNLLSFEPYEMRYLKVLCLSGSVSFDAPQIVRYENPDIYRTKFTCEDADLQKIFEASQHTLSQNAVDVLTDCPGRERAGWLCDSFFSSRVERLLTGENKVEENFLDAFLKAPQLHELPEGMFPMCYPSDHYNRMYIPNWAMWLVIELEDYVKRTGNHALADAFKEKIDALQKCFLNFENEDGLLENLDSWVCVEHSKAAEFVQDVSYPTNMLYSKMYKCIYALYNDKSALIKAENIAETVRNQSYNGTFFEDNRVRRGGVLRQTGNISETCQYYAFFTGVADKKSFPSLYERMLREFGPNRDCEKVYPNVCKSNAFIGNYLRLLYFFENGGKKEVFDECKGYFLYMANRTMTLWEHDSPLASCDHAFASYPTIFAVNVLTGFVRVDQAAKTVYFEKPVYTEDCSLRLPLDAKNYIEIEVKNGNMTRKVTGDYTIKDI